MIHSVASSQISLINLKKTLSRSQVFWKMLSILSRPYINFLFIYKEKNIVDQYYQTYIQVESIKVHYLNAGGGGGAQFSQMNG